MNAAARALHQSNLFHGHIREIRCSFMQLLQIVLFSIVLLNAVVVIYCINQYRECLSQFEHAQQDTNMLQLQWGQLLLEQASASALSRIQIKAANSLHMLTPAANQVVVVHNAGR